MRALRLTVPILAAALACGDDDVSGGSGDRQLMAEIVNTQGQRIGLAFFRQQGNGVEVEVQVGGLPPGTHGMHIHETGTCDPPAFTSAGAHLNPSQRQHGIENASGPHAGDLPNLTVRSDGVGAATALNPYVTLGGGTNSLLKTGGTALVIHAAPDDYRTDPSGNSGARIACGVIKER